MSQGRGTRDRSFESIPRVQYPRVKGGDDWASGEVTIATVLLLANSSLLESRSEQKIKGEHAACRKGLAPDLERGLKSKRKARTK